MSDDILDIFKDEADGYLKSLNDGLLKLELSENAERQALLKEMNRIAHSMKGAARAVGFDLIEIISRSLEEIFHNALHEDLTLTPGMVDTLYDGIDLIKSRLSGDDLKPEIVSEIQSNLQAILAGNRQITETKALQTDSAEIHIITDEMAELDEPDITQTAPSPQDTISDDLLSIFAIEVEDYLGQLNQHLLNVEMTKETEREELLREMNRIAHSMKGAGRAVGYEIVETVSHHMEDILEQALAGVIDISPYVADILYDSLDLIHDAVQGNPLSEEGVVAVLMQMQRIADGTERGSRARPLRPHDPVPPVEETPEMEIPPALLTSSVHRVGEPTMIMRSAEDSIRVSVSKLDQMMANTSELLTAKLQGNNRSRMLDDVRHDLVKWQREWRGARSAYIRLARRMQEHPDNLSPEMASIFRFLETNEDYLTRSNRELTRLQRVLAQDNMQLATLADQLQENVSSLRMMPFETIVGGFQRMARDVARDIGKQLHLEIRGVTVEIDKTVLDALKEPLMHLLRNALDHGIESPQERVSQGKDVVGHVLLDVEQRGSEIVITVQDDGRGFDVSRIRHKAIERDLISTQDASTLSDEDIQQLAFQSGLTTSDNVTTISGRGLGMEIVRNRIESLRGRVTINSVPAQGTTITIRVPVSLTRLSVVTIRLGDEIYAVPSSMVERMNTYPVSAIYTAEGHEILNINERPTPLVGMGSILNAPKVDSRGDDVRVLTIRTTERVIAFEVDELFNEIELVLKPVGRELVNAPFIAGVAILGTGQTIIVLDANDLARHATGDNLTTRHNTLHHPTTSDTRPTRILVVDDSITTRTLEKNILEAVGFEVHVAIDGSEAWQRMLDIAPDIIVSDVEMPKMNGLDLTRLLKSSPQTRHIPVILLTSLSKPEQREAGLNAGADAYLIKSRFDQSELLDLIQSMI
ncbi:MAG: hybrid sensor histidine kinase/response regulator [Chloroflexota bacterium]